MPKRRRVKSRERVNIIARIGWIYGEIKKILEIIRDFIFQSRKSKRRFVHLGVGLVIIGVITSNFLATPENEGSILFSLFGEKDEYEDVKWTESYTSKVATNTTPQRKLLAINSVLAQVNLEEEVDRGELASVQGGNALLKNEPPLTAAVIKREVSSGQQEVVTYEVKEGDTVSEVASKFGVSTNTVLWANNLDLKDSIKPGDKLDILPTTGVIHKVRKGDTLQKIANLYKADLEEIIEFNQLNPDGDEIKEGEELIIPDGYITPTLPSDTKPKRYKARYAEGSDIDPGAPPSKEVSGQGQFVWPTTTRHISQYFRWGHGAVDIDNRSYPPIYAADSGTVEFVGWRGGYGKTVIVNHGNGFKTVYAHASKFYVSSGETVSGGQAIAQMGSTGRSSGPHLHFEIHKNGRKVNPLQYY